MKKIKTLFLLSALSLRPPAPTIRRWTTYAGRGDEAFFGDTAYSYTVSAELEDAYSIEVLRATPAGNASVSVAVAVADAAVASAFTAPAAVEFKNGEYAAPLKISFDRAKLTIGKENVVTVTLQSETDLPYATECSLMVTRDYTWKNYGKGVYTSPILSGMFGQTVSGSSRSKVAEENASLYRLPGLYHNAGARYSVAGYKCSYLGRRRRDRFHGSRGRRWLRDDPVRILIRVTAWGVALYRPVARNIRYDSEPDFQVQLLRTGALWRLFGSVDRLGR